MAKKIKKLIKYFRKKMKKKTDLELRFKNQKLDFTNKTGKKSKISKGVWQTT